MERRSGDRSPATPFEIHVFLELRWSSGGIFSQPCSWWAAQVKLLSSQPGAGVVCARVWLRVSPCPWTGGVRPRQVQLLLMLMSLLGARSPLSPFLFEINAAHCEHAGYRFTRTGVRARTRAASPCVTGLSAVLLKPFTHL